MDDVRAVPEKACWAQGLPDITDGRRSPAGMNS